MADRVSEAQRSYNMSRIRSGNTKPELTLRKLLWSRNIRGYRLHPAITGKPDIYFPSKKLAVFVDGCFWHKCSKCYKKPASNTAFWIKKIEGNKKRDWLVNQALKNKKTKVVRFWEHEIETNVRKCADKIEVALQTNI